MLTEGGFTRQMATLATYCRCAMDEEQTALYGAALGDLTDAQLARAVLHVVRTYRYVKYGELVPVAVLRDAVEETMSQDERARARRRSIIGSAERNGFLAPGDARKRLAAIDREERAMLTDGREHS